VDLCHVDEGLRSGYEDSVVEQLERVEEDVQSVGSVLLLGGLLVPVGVQLHQEEGSVPGLSDDPRGKSQCAYVSFQELLIVFDEGETIVLEEVAFFISLLVEIVLIIHELYVPPLYIGLLLLLLVLLLVGINQYGWRVFPEQCFSELLLIDELVDDFEVPHIVDEAVLPLI
jgi:hypothetical protein